MEDEPQSTETDLTPRARAIPDGLLGERAMLEAIDGATGY
jgi:hypothetical protein